LLALASPAAAQLPGLPTLPGLPGSGASLVQPYGNNDGLGFRNILPPGQSGAVSASDLAQFEASCPPTGSKNCPNAARPPHNADQLGMYGDLVYASPGLKGADVGKYFKDATFGVKDGDVERAYQPRSDVTVVRDKGFGVPHVYGATRAGTMFGLGYVGAEDRLFLMDVLRHAGRAQLSSFAGGAAGNRDMDHTQWELAPYTEADLQRQFDLGDDVYGAAGKALQDDVTNYVAGINAYIQEARANPLKMPAEYAAFGRVQGPDDWKVTDVIATASLIGGIFGKGGGRELDSALLLQHARSRFGMKRGKRIWKDLRTADDPEAPTTVLKKKFPYRAEPRKLRKGSSGMPDRHSVKKLKVVASSTAGAASHSNGFEGLLNGFPRSSSNALLVSAKESKTGKPIAVMGPQTAYFAPQLLMEQDVHGPGIDARGATFAGVSLYVLLGRGRDYAWSATSAGQDIIDTFAVPLCEPSGKKPTTASMYYRFRGQCLPIEVLERQNSWTPNAADSTPAGSETLRAERTKLGLVTARGKVHRKPVAYTSLRSTYFHEADSALGFTALNNPAVVKSPADFQRAVSHIGFTFNWFYIDPKNISYFNSGNNPQRASRVSANFPVSSRFTWKGFNPDLNIARYTPFKAHPRVTNQPYLVSWNNKQARKYRAADDNFGFGAVYRSNSLSDRVRKGIRGKRKMTLLQLIDAMEDAGTVDLRATKDLPYALRILGKPKNRVLRKAVNELRAWVKAGGHRRDRDRNLVYEHSRAIQILDAWWPLWLEAEFKPVMGPTVFRDAKSMLPLDDPPNGNGVHHGSAYQNGWYGYAQTDLRRLLGRKRLKGLRGAPRGGARLSRVYCGGKLHKKATLRRCRSMLSASLGKALGVDPKKLYADDDCADYGMPSNQWCYDTVLQRPAGAISQQLIPWINRPTFQQVIEIQKSVPR
jgi:acyl-homoserine lactone acylase PvdQ